MQRFTVFNESITKYKIIIILFLILTIFYAFSVVLYKGKTTENYDSINNLNENKIKLKSTKYDSNNYDVVYHDIEADLNTQSGIYKTQKNFYNVIDKNGKMISVPYYGNENPTLPIYNQPGSFIYGTSNYTPTYLDSIYLSKTTGVSTTRKLTPEYNYIGGFCQQYKHSKTELEQKCNALPRDQCASTSCCVLLGGSKCVSGNDKGPYRKANYTDRTIRNKDYYYYNSKCYGRCDSSIKNDLSDDENDKQHSIRKKKNNSSEKHKVSWETYLTPEENNLLEKDESSADDPRSSNLNNPYLYSKNVKKKRSPWKNPSVLISPSNAFEEKILTNKNEVLQGKKI